MHQGNVISEGDPDEICLISYLESPHSVEFQDIRHHLVTCPVCREAVMDIQAAIKTMRGLVPSMGGQPSGEHPSASVIAGYVDRRLSTGRCSAIRKHLDECSFCTKAASLCHQQS